jgi:hypothetical protein
VVRSQDGARVFRVVLGILRFLQNLVRDRQTLLVQRVVVDLCRGMCNVASVNIRSGEVQTRISDVRANHILCLWVSMPTAAGEFASKHYQYEHGRMHITQEAEGVRKCSEVYVHMHAG